MDLNRANEVTEVLWRQLKALLMTSPFRAMAESGPQQQECQVKELQMASSEQGILE